MQFKAYDYVSAMKILKKGYDIKFEGLNNPVMLIVAGPNASGKSTYIANLYKQGLIKIPYINADIINQFELKDIEDETERNLKGMQIAMQRVENAIDNKQSFVYETVLSHPSKLELVKFAKSKGFDIYSIFVYTSNPKINLNRLKKRVEKGGHDVPAEKVVNRYYRSISYKNDLKELSDTFLEFDNSEEKDNIEENENS